MKHNHIIACITALLCIVLIALLVLLAVPAKAVPLEYETNLKWREDVPMSAELQNSLLKVCEKHGIDPLLALGLIETESGFVVDIVSPGGDYGLCQLNSLYFPTDLTPEENLDAGLGLLAYNLKRYHGSVAAALTAYNRGHDDGSRTYANVVLEKAAKWGYDND